MSTPLEVFDIVALKVACFCQGQLGLNVRHYLVTSVSGGGITDDDFATEMDGELEALYKSWLGTDAEYFGVNVQIVNRTPKPISETVSANTGIGTALLPALPGQASGIITFRTAVVGRAYRGRSYIPFGSAIWNEPGENRPSAAAVAVLNSIGTELRITRNLVDGADTADLDPVIYRPELDTFTAITAAVGRQAWATQRRRGNYGRVNSYPPF